MGLLDLCFFIAVIENMLNIFQEETSLFNPQLVIQRDAQRETQSHNIIKSCSVDLHLANVYIKYIHILSMRFNYDNVTRASSSCATIKYSYTCISDIIYESISRIIFRG